MRGLWGLLLLWFCLSFSIPVPDRHEVRKALSNLIANKEDVEIILKRANRYLPVIKPIISSYGLPEELSLLPAVESSFNPFAVSKSGAAGLWQLMPETARNYGLRVDKFVDERFDPVKSTHAAARYLKDLYELFGSWDLALAAYNCGEGCVIRKTNGSSFWLSKHRLPEETQSYVPTFFAYLTLLREPERFGLRVPKDLELTYRRVAKRPITVSDLIASLGISESTFRDLNPHVKGNVIPPGTNLYLPVVPKSAKKLRPTPKKIARLPKAKTKRFKRITLVRKISPKRTYTPRRSKIKVIKLSNGATLYIKE